MSLQGLSAARCFADAEPSDEVITHVPQPLPVCSQLFSSNLSLASKHISAVGTSNLPNAKDNFGQ
jgi:hypothetical protein